MALVFAAGACALAAHGGGRADWMRGSFGISVHWTANCACADGACISFEEAVRDFDAERFAETLSEAGARHCIFTVTHALQKMPCPNAALDRIAPGYTSRRDMLADVSAALRRRGIRLIAYYNHSCNGNDDVEWRRQGSPCRRVSRTANWQTSLQRIGHKARCSPSTSSSPPTGPSTPPRSRNFGDARDDRRVPRPRGCDQNLSAPPKARGMCASAPTRRKLWESFTDVAAPCALSLALKSG